MVALQKIYFLFLSVTVFSLSNHVLYAGLQKGA